MTQHASHTTAGFFNADMAAGYDQRNAGLKPISDCLHFLMGMVLEDLPPDARILCVGVGTGAEILALAGAHPGWSFTGVDSSAEMLAVGRDRLGAAGVLGRCRLVHGYVDDVADTGFDAVVSLLVAHFVAAADRPAFYRAIHDRLRPGGRFVSAEISADLDAAAAPAMTDDWRLVHARMGADADALAALPAMLRDVLAVVTPDRTEALWRDAGFVATVPFFQGFLIRAWHARKG